MTHETRGQRIGRYIELPVPIVISLIFHDRCTETRGALCCTSAGDDAAETERETDNALHGAARADTNVDDAGCVTGTCFRCGERRVGDLTATKWLRRTSEASRQFDRNQDDACVADLSTTLLRNPVTASASETERKRVNYSHVLIRLFMSLKRTALFLSI